MKILFARALRVSAACRLIIAAALIALTTALPAAHAADENTAELETRIEDLNQQLEDARAEVSEAEQKLAAGQNSSSNDIKLGPFTIGGAMRINYVNGDYVVTGEAPQRGGNGGNFELDTFRINVSLDYQQYIGKLEYRWYNGYNFLHTGWLGYDFAEAGEVQVGVTRVPFGPGPYGISQSWFFDQHYYVGLADDMDLGVKYLTERGNWDLAFAYFFSSEGNWNGASEDSARYSYDTVKWRSGLDANGDVIAASVNGYQERNQFNARAIYQFQDLGIPTDLGLSLQYGKLDGEMAEDGDHWAASAHMINRYRNFTLATQITRFELDISADNLLGTDELIPMGAYDFAWPVATKAWLPAVSLSYRYDTPQLPWLGYVLPYIEYSSIIKDSDLFNNSELFIVGAVWSSGGWYIYTDMAFSNGNLFIGNIGDDYSNVFDGVGDFGANGNDRWNSRFNINFGYYF